VRPAHDLEALVFQLREDHMSAFECLAHDAMVERIAGAMYLLRPETRAVRIDEFLAEVDRQSRRAGTYGLVAEADVATYVDCAWQLGPAFDREFPVIRAALTHRRLTPADKARRIAEHTRRILLTLREEV
jgi:hypothetical protein